jgi:hypothetical protein
VQALLTEVDRLAITIPPILLRGSRAPAKTSWRAALKAEQFGLERGVATGVSTRTGRLTQANGVAFAEIGPDQAAGMDLSRSLIIAAFASGPTEFHAAAQSIANVVRNGASYCPRHKPGDSRRLLSTRSWSWRTCNTSRWLRR